MKNTIVVVSLSACSNPLRPVYTAYEDFQQFDPATCFDKDQAVQYLKSQGFEILPIISARARGKMTLETYMRFARQILDRIPTDGSVAGCLLYLASGMVVDEIGNGDMHLIPMIREHVGYDIPMAIPMDFHGNMPFSVLKSCNIITSFRTNPHMDVPATQLRAAQLLSRAIHEKALPENRAVVIPFAIADSMTCAQGAGHKINAILNTLETLPGVWSANLVTNMYWSNNLNTQALLTISCDRAAAPALEDALLRASQEIWALRDAFISINERAEPAEAYRIAAQYPGDGPFFVDDAGDNPTCSATGDSAYMLGLALEMNMQSTLVAGIWDPNFTALCEKAGEGAPVSGKIGAAIDPHSTCIEVSGIVKKLRYTADGVVDGACVVSGGVTFTVTRISDMHPLYAPLNRTFIESFGENVMNYRVVVLKLGYLLDDFVQVMRGCRIAVSPGACDLNIQRLSQQLTGIRRPLYPFDPDTVFEPHMV